MSLNLIAWINETGYGYHGVNVVSAASRLGLEVALWSLGPVSASAMYEPAVSQALRNQSRYDYNKPSVNISPPGLLSFHVGKGLRVGWPVFELNKFSVHDTQQIYSQDMVLVNSRWAKEVFEAEFPAMPCQVVPEGVDREIFHENVEKAILPGNRDAGAATVFMNAGKWEERKGQRLLLSAFNKAFEPTDDVLLILLCHNPFYDEINRHWEALCRASKLSDKILIWNERLGSQHDVANVMALADCGVFPARAEGWNLELLEMMSMGKTVIATNYSAHTEYCTSQNSMLVDIDALEPANDGLWFFGHGEWAAWCDNQEEQLIAHMREAHRRKQCGYTLINEQGIEMAKQYSWENCVRTLTKAIG